MSQDLIGAGFTHNSSVKCRIDLIDRAIDSIPDETLRDEEFLNAIDPAESVLNIVADDANTPATVRDYLKQGLEEYDSAIAGHRSTVAFGIPGTPLAFVFAGGGSWGDDPYDGFTELCLFMNLCSHDDGIRELAGYVCGGLPGAALVALHSA